MHGDVLRPAGAKLRALRTELRMARKRQKCSVTFVECFIILLNIGLVSQLTSGKMANQVKMDQTSNPLSTNPVDHVRRLNNATDDAKDDGVPTASGADASSTSQLPLTLKMGVVALEIRAVTVEALKLTGQRMQDLVGLLSTQNLRSWVCLAWQIKIGTDVRYGIFAGVVLLSLVFVSLACMQLRSKYTHGVYRAILDASETSFCSPTQWIDLTGMRFEVRVQHDQNIVYCLAPNTEGAEEDVEPEEQHDEPPQQIWVEFGQLYQSPGGRLTLHSSGEVADEGVVAEKCIIWKRDKWYRCEIDVLMRDDHVMLLDGYKWVDGVVKSVDVSGQGEPTYSVLVYGISSLGLEDALVPLVNRWELLKVNVSLWDRITLIKQGVQHIVDVFLDCYSMAIFVAHRQFKYLSANLLAIVISALESQQLLVVFTNALFSCTFENLQELCSWSSIRNFSTALIGVDFIFEWREAWRRGYPTDRFQHFRATESSVEGMGSMAVQTYAFVFSSAYSVTDQLVILSSLFFSIVGYSSAFGIEFSEISFGQMLFIPQDQRDFRAKFPKTLLLVQLTRILETASRLCVAMSFSVVFRPLGVIAWAIWSLLLTTVIFSFHMPWSYAFWNGLQPASWMGAMEPYLMNHQVEPFYSGRRPGDTRKIVMIFNFAHAFETIAMLLVLYLLKPVAVIEILLEGHHSFVFVTGLIVTPLSWLSQVCALWAGTNPALQHFDPPGDMQRERDPVQPERSSSVCVCCQ